MAIKAIVDEIPKGMEAFYLEDNGRFRLNVEPVDGFELDNIIGLKKTLSDVRADREKLRGTVAKFGDLDPDAARAALEAMPELESLRQLDPKSEADKIAAAKIEAATKALGKKHAEAMEAATARAETLMRTVDDVLRKQAATKALADAKGSVDLLLPHVMARTRVVENDGRFSVEVLDEYGNARVNNKGEGLTLGDFVSEMRNNETYGRAFEPSGSTGSGKGPTSGGGSAGATSGDMGGDRSARSAAIASRFNLPRQG